MTRTRHKFRPIWYAAPFLLLLAFCISGCGITHQTYHYRAPNSFLLDHAAGSTFAIQWQAQPGQTAADSSPTPLVLKVSLIGPFQHIDDVLGAIRNHINDPILTHMGPIVATAPPIQTNNWTNKTFISTISLPVALQLGYYVLALTVNGDAATRVNALVRIDPHS